MRVCVRVCVCSHALARVFTYPAVLDVFVLRGFSGYFVSSVPGKEVCNMTI